MIHRLFVYGTLAGRGPPNPDSGNVANTRRSVESSPKYEHLIRTKSSILLMGPMGGPSASA